MITKQLRNLFANVSTSNGNYFPTKGHAVAAFEEVLLNANLSFDADALCGFDGDQGSKSVTICDCCNHPVGNANLSWYRMPSGAYEFTAYLT